MEKEKIVILKQKIKAARIMLDEIEKSLDDLAGEEVELPEEPKIKETFLGDDGKVYEKSVPYIKAKQWYCCGRPLVRNGKKFHCDVCNADYAG